MSLLSALHSAPMVLGSGNGGLAALLGVTAPEGRPGLGCAGPPGAGPQGGRARPRSVSFPRGAPTPWAPVLAPSLGSRGPWLFASVCGPWNRCCPHAVYLTV